MVCNSPGSQVFSANSLNIKRVVTEVVLFSIVAFKTLDISESGVATHLRRGGIFSGSIITATVTATSSTSSAATITSSSSSSLSVLFYIFHTQPDHHWRSQTRHIEATNHFFHYDERATLTWPHCSIRYDPIRSITGLFASSRRGHQPPPSGLESIDRSTKTKPASCDWLWPTATRSWPQFSMRKTVQHGTSLWRRLYALSVARHLQ